MRSINFLSILVLSLGLALGCGGSGDSGDPSNPGGGSGGDGGSTGNGGNGTETYKASIHVKAPNDLIGSFYRAEPGDCKVTAEKADSPDANCVVVCPGVKECSFDITDRDDFELIFVTARHLFAPKLISGVTNNDTVEITWSGPGSWGLAPPKGWYRDQESHAKSEVETKVEQEHVLLLVNGIPSLIEGNKYSYVRCEVLDVVSCSPDERRWEGEVSEDLIEVKWKQFNIDGSIGEMLLVRME